MSNLLGTFQMDGFQRRLTRMYTDTKSSYDFVKEPASVAEDPDLAALYRKLRIQKDRLLSWGLEWSDPSQSPDIDESLSKAGLSDIVGSIMSTIKDTLAEAEPLWRASRGLEGRGEKTEKSIDSKLPIVAWDRTRFEDLLRDLTESIDILCDLSRNRQDARQASISNKFSSLPSSTRSKSSKAEQAHRFESTRIRIPQQIDPLCLIDPRDPETPNRFGTLPRTFSNGENAERQIVYIRRQASSTNPWKTESAPPLSPVLLEYAKYDPIYASTGIPPEMDKYEKLFAALQNVQGAVDRPDFGVLNLIGYFEDARNARFGLLYELPNQSSTWESRGKQATAPHLVKLSTMFQAPQWEPSLEVKYRLAFNIALTIFDLHTTGVVHGGLNPQNILFLEDPLKRGDPAMLRRPFITSFELFPESAQHQLKAGELQGYQTFYQHPADPRQTPYTVLTHQSLSIDLYSLGVILVEICLWRSLSDTISGRSLANVDWAELYREVDVRCGKLYSKTVQSCFRAADVEFSQPRNGEEELQSIWAKVYSSLELCCAIDDEEDISFPRITPKPSPPKMPIVQKADALALQSDYPQKTDAVTEFQLPAKMPTADASLKKKAAPSRGRMERATLPPEPQWKTDVGLPPDLAKKMQDFLASTPRSKELPAPVIDIRNTLPPDPQWRADAGMPAELAKKMQDFVASRSSAKGTSSPKIDIVVQRPSVTAPKPNVRLFPNIPLEQHHWQYWQSVLTPSINRALRTFYKKYPESVEISLESVGESATSTKPTILVICTSVGKVRSILKKHFVYDSSAYGLMVCKGKVSRSRKNPPRRSGAGDGLIYGQRGKNPDYQKRPLNGASIGAYVENQHLPAVSFGGLVMVGDKPYGLTVHHMLDNNDTPDHAEVPRSSSGRQSMQAELDELDLEYGNDEDGYALSEHDSDYSDTSSIAESFSDHDETYQPRDFGDQEGVPVDCGDDYKITQPALDDVSENFFGDSPTIDDDHLDSHQLGEVYASSGIRRRYHEGVIHEVDWALFKFESDRLPNGNFIKGGEVHCPSKPSQTPYPVDIAPWSGLHGLHVHCNGRTTGLQTGRIMPGMTIVKIIGRQTPSSSYQVTSTGKLGMAGDSGAWVIDNKEGKACGHILAWSERKSVAYICPMEIILKDIEATLGVEVGLPKDAISDAVRSTWSTDNVDTCAELLGETSLDDYMTTPKLKDEKHLANIRYRKGADDELVDNMHKMHVSHGLVSQS